MTWCIKFDSFFLVLSDTPKDLSMSLKQLILLGCLLVFIAPSFQYGTIFADNVRPAFSDRTFFSGIKSEEVLTTDAAVGTKTFYFINQGIFEFLYLLFLQ